MTHTATSNSHSAARSRQPAIVVGVDGSERNQAAIDWATAEAVRVDHDLHLVSVANAVTASEPWIDDVTKRGAIEEAAKTVERIRRRILPVWGRTDVDVPCGSPARELVEAAEPRDVLVLGRRGIGSLRHAILGSTSTAVAGRAAVPTVIVPDDWDQAARSHGPIVAGVDGSERDGAVLDFAFRRAHELSVTLLVIGAWETPRLYDWESLDYGTAPWLKQAEERLAEALEEWTSRYPGVDLASYAPNASASDALLRNSDGAQLVVLGRKGGAHDLFGFSGFSTCRRVLHHATCPVAIVPATLVEMSELAFDECDVPEF